MIWSFALAGIGILGLWLAGKKNKWGWAIGIFAQLLWAIYALATGQLGFLISCTAYAVVYGRNYLKWDEESNGNS